MEAKSGTGFQDPLSTVKDSGRTSKLSVDAPAGVEPSAPEASNSPTPSMTQQPAEGAVDNETTVDQQGDDKKERTDSSSNCSPEVLQYDKNIYI